MFASARGAERLGVVRGPGAEPGPFKEWLHLCASGPTGLLLVNLSHERGGSGSAGRAIIVADRQRSATAQVIEPSEPDWVFEPGVAAARVAGCRFDWRGDQAQLELDAPDGSVRGTLALRSAATPAWTGSIPMPTGAELSWVVAPHWTIERGSLWVDGEPVLLDGWQAYHDHNWGRFRWADDFAWEWAYGHPRIGSDPACVVFGRLTDRVCARIASKVLMVWWEGRQVRTFRGADVRVRLVGEVRADDSPPAPGAARLLLPKRPCGVPAVIEVRARRGDDALTVCFETRRVHRLGVPEDGNPIGLRVLHEIHARVQCVGVIGGRAIDMRGDGGSELLRHV